jgi:hypothetical protein
MKDRVMDKEVGRRFADGIVDISLQVKAWVLRIGPIIIAAPVSVEIEIRDVIIPPLLAKTLIKNRRKARGDFRVSLPGNFLNILMRGRPNRLLRGDDAARTDELQAQANDESKL